MQLIEELKRRNVFKVGAAYLALGWVVTQVTGAVVPALHLPESINTIVVWLGMAAFPFVIVFAWVFEITPEGIKRESEVDRSQSITHLTSRRLDYTIIAMLAMAMLLFVADRFIPRPADSSSSVGAGHARDGRGHGPLLQEDADREQGAVPQENSAATPAPAAAPAPDDKSIAVLPFADMSQARDQEYFSDGIAEELLNQLAKVPALRVAARTSSFSYKGKDTQIGQIGRELHVAHVLEGSIRKAGNKIRITAQLVRAADGYHLWSETYDRSLDDIFAVQDEIAGAVVTQLKIALLGAAPRATQTDPKAYALFLQARQVARQYTPAGYNQAIDLFQQVLAIDPSYAAALDGLATAYLNQIIDALEPAEKNIPLAREAVSRALASDPDYAPAHGRLAWIAMTYDHDMAAAARHMEHAVTLDPANFATLGNSLPILLNLGRVDQAIALGEYLAAQDPVNTANHANLASAYLAAGQTDAAIRASNTARSLSPGFISVQILIGTALLQKGEVAAALAAMQQESGEPQRLAGVAIARHALGQHAESDAALAALIAKYAGNQSYSIAGVLAYRGEADRAFEWLDKAVQAHDPALVSIATDPILVSIHDDPRWLPLLRTLGLAPEQLAAIPFEIKLPR